jgi:large subunit ribosomal protein L6
MSRIGKLAIAIDGVTVDTKDATFITVKGAKHALKIRKVAGVTADVKDGKLVLTSKSEDKKTKSLYGLQRALLYNAVVGVTKGFSKALELNGVGYRATVSGKKLELSLGYSHNIEFPIPEGIEIKVDKQTAITVTGPNKELVGQVAAKIRGFRPPEPYLGKGVKYSDETIRRKAGKSAGQ